jgi:hypothetical protein
MPKIGTPAPVPAPSVADIEMSPMPALLVANIGMPAPSMADIGMSPMPAPSVADIGISPMPALSATIIGIPAPIPAPSVAGIGVQAAPVPLVPKIGMPAPMSAPSVADIGMPAPSMAGIGISPKPAPSVSDTVTPAALPAPSAAVNRMPDAVDVRAAAGNELPAAPLAPALAMVATQLPAAVPAIEPPSMLRKPTLSFIGPSGADELTVVGVDRNRPPGALAVKGSPNLTLASAVDPGIPQQRTWAAASVPLPSSAPEALPTSYQPPTWSQGPAPEAAKSPVSTTDLKSGLHAVDPSADTASKLADGQTQIEQTASPNVLSSLPTTSSTGATDPAPPIKVGTHAAQILPTVIMLAKSGQGGEQMTIRLHPAELGMVQVRIERAASGAAPAGAEAAIQHGRPPAGPAASSQAAMPRPLRRTPAHIAPVWTSPPEHQRRLF